MNEHEPHINQDALDLLTKWASEPVDYSPEGIAEVQSFTRAIDRHADDELITAQAKVIEAARALRHGEAGTTPWPQLCDEFDAAVDELEQIERGDA